MSPSTPIKQHQPGPGSGPLSPAAGLGGPGEG